MKHLIISLTLVGFTTLSYSQLVGNASFGTDYKNTAVLGTVGVDYGFKLLNDKLTVGPGIRFGAFSGSDLKYITAPDELTSDDKNIDTLVVDRAKVNAVNLYLKLEYHVNAKLKVGVDFDLVGTSFGSTLENLPLIQGVNHQQILYLVPPTAEEASPTSNNVVNLGDKKKGSLNTSIYGSYLINDHIGISAGYRFVCTEYTTSKKVGWMQHDRFRKRGGMLFVGMSYTFAKEKQLND
jgi:hypothetical protein